MGHELEVSTSMVAHWFKALVDPSTHLDIVVRFGQSKSVDEFERHSFMARSDESPRHRQSPERMLSPANDIDHLSSRGASLSAIDSRDVQDRRQLNEYLSQSISNEYRVRSEEGGVTQTATYIKSYVVEGHDDLQATDQWLQVFVEALPRRDEELLLLIDRGGISYFVDRADSRFMVIHTIGRTDAADNALDRLTHGTTAGFDRAWMPTDFLYGTRRGPLRGFKFGHLAAVDGIAELGEDSATLGSGVDYPQLLGFGDHEPPMTAVQTDEAPRIVGPLVDVDEPGPDTISRLTVSNTLSAERDYILIRDAAVFAGRQALDTVQFVTRVDNDARISASVYATGKIVGSGTSLGLYMLVVEGIRSNYGRTIRKIEDDYALGWVTSGEGQVHHGEPLIFQFPEGMITDLTQFVGSLLRATRPFRLFGIPHGITDQRINVEAIDLHTHDRLSFEVTKSWMRVYLPKGSCGNIIARLYTNLQHTADSNISLISGSEDLLFTESDARNE